MTRILDATDEDAIVTKIYTGKTARTLKCKYMDYWSRPDAPITLPMPLQNLYSPMPHFLTTEDQFSVGLFDKPDLSDYATTATGNAIGLIRQRKSVRQINDMIAQAVEILE